MTRRRITRKASDNRYLHQDFHGALSNAIEYLHRRYGPDAVREYLRQFTRNFYAPLRQSIRSRGLVALKNHYENVYRSEGETIHINLADDMLTIEVDRSPAVMHMREHGYAVAELFHETVRTVNEALCENTPYDSELRNYDPKTGACTMLFRRSTS